jgi:diguanylate cyclase (GGDEF)-like protein/PAS domain S-box-containing protein
MAYRCKWDQDWTMLFVSKGCYDLTGYQPEDLINNRRISFNSLIAKDFKQSVAVKWDVVLRRNKPFTNEYVIVTATGEKKWVLEQGQGILDDKGQVEAIEGLIIDITLQKQKQDEIAYLTYHDSLTGVSNRIFFDSEVKRLDKIQSNPLSIIICDINGLKLVNDGFGHIKGDEIIIMAANILKHACVENDILARVGGDEFAILMPKTSLIEVEKRFDLINQFCKDYNNTINNEAFHINISLGYATRVNEFDDFSLTIKSAEDYMLKRKLFERKSSHSAILSSITATMFEKCEETEQHAERLNSLTAMLGKALNLSEFELDELALLATLHDIGKVGIDDKILKKPGKLTEEEWKIMKKHPSIGYRIAKATPELSSIAEYILCHHERWDGNGYPQNLSGDNIPLLSRIVAVADAFDAMTVDRVYRKAMTEEAAIQEIVDNSGTQFDPEIALTFVNLIQNLN